MYNFGTCSLPVQNVLVRLQVLCKFCTSRMKASGPLNSFPGLALDRHPTGICRASHLEHFGPCNARNPAGLAVMYSPLRFVLSLPSDALQLARLVQTWQIYQACSLDAS
jgi:hypothetical protein